MKCPRVTIGVPIYGVETFIEKCAISLFEQNYANIEYIFLNDCTKDKSIEILFDVISRYPCRQKDIKVLSHNANKGLGATRNDIVSCAQGDFILHVDSDDWLEPNTVDECIKNQIRDDSDIVLFNYFAHYKNRVEKVRVEKFATPRQRCLAQLSRKTSTCVWNGMIRKKLYDVYKIAVAKGVNNGEDFCVTPLLTYYSKRISYLDNFLYNYNLTNENSYSNYYSKQKESQVLMAFSRLESWSANLDLQFVRALNKGKALYVAESMVMSAESCCHKDFKELKKKYCLLSRDSKKDIPIKLKLVGYLGNYYITRFFLLTKKIIHFFYDKD